MFRERCLLPSLFARNEEADSAGVGSKSGEFIAQSSYFFK
jgi:hypothetical protein